MTRFAWLAALAWLLVVGLATGSAAEGLDFAHYQGGGLEDTCRDVAFDTAGSLYAAGGTKSTNFTTTDGTTLNPGANGATNGAHDAWVAKYDTAGALVWSTLIGGSGYDRAYAIEVNDTGVYIAGRAGAGFPTTAGAMQMTFGGDGANQENAYGPQDGFVAKLNHDGVVQWATYVGGPDRNIVRDMDIDATGAVYAGVTGFGTLPHVTTGAFDTSPGSGLNATIVKIAPSGGAAVWGTYLGATGDDGNNPSVRVDPSGGAVYVLAFGSSTDFPITSGAHQNSPGGASDLTLSAIAPDGSGLVFSTYLGGNGDEGVETHGLALLGTRLAIAATTRSSNLATTAGVAQRTAGGNADVILAVFNTDGTHVATSYLGGSDVDAAEGVGYMADGRIALGGLVMGTGLTPGVDVTWVGAALEGFVAVVTGDLTSIDYAAVIGGRAEDTFRSLAVHGPTSRIAFGGLTQSTDFPVTDSSTYRSTGGSYDARDAIVGWVTERAAPCTMNGATQACYTGPSDTSGVGECVEGVQTCTNNAWGACTNQVVPAIEQCSDSLDNDCDGLVDAEDENDCSKSGGGSGGATSGSGGSGGGPGRPDASAAGAAGPGSDAGSEGALQSSGDSDCGCSVPGRSRAASWWFALLALLSLRFVRHRKIDVQRTRRPRRRRVGSRNVQASQYQQRLL